MRKSDGALIIKDKSLLLVSRDGVGYFWTPGGTIEMGETDMQTLKRELNEELGIKLVSAQLYARMEYPQDNVSSSFYMAAITGEPKPNNEVSKIIWYTKDNFRKQEPKISTWINGKILPDLIKDNYL